MRFLLGFLFGAGYTANRAFRVAFLLLILVVVFCFYQMSKPLGHNRRVPTKAPSIETAVQSETS
jgi:hypothetical protein